MKNLACDKFNISRGKKLHAVITVPAYFNNK